jgi:hypothetical protein
VSRQQVAVREGVTLTFVYGDHLGSASVTANITGTTPTSKRFSSQEEVDYNAGRVAGQVAALAASSWEIAGGITTIIGSIGGGAAGSAVCTVAALGSCVPVAVGATVPIRY